MKTCISSSGSAFNKPAQEPFCNCIIGICRIAFKTVTSLPKGIQSIYNIIGTRDTLKLVSWYIKPEFMKFEIDLLPFVNDVILNTISPHYLEHKRIYVSTLESMTCSSKYMFKTGIKPSHTNTTV